MDDISTFWSCNGSFSALRDRSGAGISPMYATLKTSNKTGKLYKIIIIIIIAHVVIIIHSKASRQQNYQ